MVKLEWKNGDITDVLQKVDKRCTPKKSVAHKWMTQWRREEKITADETTVAELPCICEEKNYS